MSRPAVVLLVRHAPTPATRRGAFPLDESLDERGVVEAANLSGTLGADRAVAGPARRCLETARLAGHPAPRVDDRFAELDFGAWSGRTLAEVWDANPTALGAWLADPGIAPPGGERLGSLAERVWAALEDLAQPGTTTAVFTSGGPVKVAVLHALGAPAAGVWRLDVAPCSVTELHARTDKAAGETLWTVTRVNAPVRPAQRPRPPAPVAVPIESA